MGLEGEIFTVLSDCSFNPIIQSTIVFDRFEAYHGLLKSFGQSQEVAIADHAGLFMVPC